MRFVCFCYCLCIECVARDNSSSSSVAQRCRKAGQPCWEETLNTEVVSAQGEQLPGVWADWAASRWTQIRTLMTPYNSYFLFIFKQIHFPGTGSSLRSPGPRVGGRRGLKENSLYLNSKSTTGCDQNCLPAPQITAQWLPWDSTRLHLLFSLSGHGTPGLSSWAALSQSLPFAYSEVTTFCQFQVSSQLHSPSAFRPQPASNNE